MADDQPPVLRRRGTLSEKLSETERGRLLLQMERAKLEVGELRIEIADLEATGERLRTRLRKAAHTDALPAMAEEARLDT